MRRVQVRDVLGEGLREYDSSIVEACVIRRQWASFKHVIRE